MQSGGCGFESQPGLRRTKVYSAFHPSVSVNEYQLRLGRQRQVWLIPITYERVGVQVKLRNPLKTRAIPEPERFCGGDSLRLGAISSVWIFTFTFTFHHTFTVSFQAQNSPFPQIFSAIVCQHPPGLSYRTILDRTNSVQRFFIFC